MSVRQDDIDVAVFVDVRQRQQRVVEQRERQRVLRHHGAGKSRARAVAREQQQRVADDSDDVGTLVAVNVSEQAGPRPRRRHDARREAAVAAAQQMYAR